MRNRDRTGSTKGGHAVAAAMVVAALVGGWSAADPAVIPSAQAAEQGNGSGTTMVRDAGTTATATAGDSASAGDSDSAGDEQVARFVIPVTGKKVEVDPAIDGFAQKAYRLDVTSAWAKVPEGDDHAEGAQPAEGQRLRISDFSGPKNARMLLVDDGDVLLDSRDLDKSTVRLGSDYLFDTDGNYLVTFVVDDPAGAGDSDEDARKVHVRFAVGQSAAAATPAQGSQITGIVAAMKNIESQLKRLAVVIPAMVDAWRGLLALPGGAGGSSAANSATKQTGTAQPTGSTKPSGNGQAGGQNQAEGQGDEYLINVDKNAASGNAGAAAGAAGAASGTAGASDDAQAAAKALGYSHAGGASTASSSGSGSSTSGKLPLAPGYSDPAESSSASGSSSSDGDSAAQGVHKLDSPGKDHSTPAKGDGSGDTVSNSTDASAAAGSDDEKTGVAALAAKMADGGFAAGLLAGIGLMALLGGLLFFVLALRNYRKAKASANAR